MHLTLKKYQKTNFKDFDKCMVGLQEFLVKIDPLKRTRKGPKYSPKYALNLVEEIKKYNGTIFLAYDDKKVVACIAGIMEKQSKNNLLECVPTRAGRILELFVEKDYRSHGIGQKLMEKMENYFQKKHCNLIRIEVFEPNKIAHNFYKKLDYGDRIVDMIKILK